MVIFTRHMQISNFQAWIERKHFSVLIQTLFFHPWPPRIFWQLLLLWTSGSYQKGSPSYLPEWKTSLFSQFYGLWNCWSLSWVCMLYVLDILIPFSLQVCLHYCAITATWKKVRAAMSLPEVPSSYKSKAVIHWFTSSVLMQMLFNIKMEAHVKKKWLVRSRVMLSKSIRFCSYNLYF